ncbi:MAG TPA: HAMP domain-containing sensor histidine kinase [Streptosporangiaceae bacterium]|nr:HAMP domain-containing sensor histidine kinase [Streptosporangiaceae bacterium]
MSAWNLFPYPTLLSNSSTETSTFENGSIFATPATCSQCPTRECLNDSRAKWSEFRECRFGINYVRIDDHRLVTGIVAPGLPGATKRAKRRARLDPGLRANPGDVLKAISSVAALGPGVVADFERSKQEILDNLRSDPQMFSALAQQLRKDFQETLNRSHDFLQLVKLVHGYAETLLQEKLPGSSNLDAAEKLPVEGAIYFATELMLLKMDALIYLDEINIVHGAESEVKIHPYILKYCRIYRWQAEQKDLDLQLHGECRGSYWYNDNAIGAVLQGLLDNLVKYSPAGSKATITFQEDSKQVLINFTSLGPKIEEDELQQIFLPGFRARAAREVASGGLGLGLATAKQISDALDLNLTVHQDSAEDSKYRDRFSTTFSITLSRE